MVFGQVVIGPPGSGKTTYCNGMSQFLSLIGRKVAVINLDPANDSLPYPLYECAVNIEDLVKLSDVMMEHALGPNGGLVYCMDYLEKNIDWLQSKLEPLLKDHYLLFDFPGQVELFFLHSNAKNVIMRLIKKLNLRLTAVHLVDAHLCSDPGKYVSALLLSLSTMLHLELPHVNVLSKIDLIENYGKLAFNLEYYTDVQDLSYLQHALGQDPRSAKYRKLTKELCDVIEDYSLVNFSTLDIQDKESVAKLVKLIDKSNGYIFAGMDASAVEFSKIAVRNVDWDYYRYPSFHLFQSCDSHIHKTFWLFNYGSSFASASSNLYV
ncbi:GPN-loop GTPase 2 [Citrus sinensis]|uniref:GPN-loop GTPase 2 n=1 Tax=Citrus sinensis TaxID=2711 RepID=A0ACB8K8M8_CITSI|nr:GPN-loop GTPase 2 [Citrus sinensis]